MPEDTEVRICPKHNIPLTFFEKDGKWYCKDCLYSSFLTAQAQAAAVTRYNHTDKHKESEKAYEQDKGKTARKKYLQSDKYKQRRKEYNERLADSLRIARAAHLDRAQSSKAVETKQKEEFAELIADIREYVDSQNRQPSSKNVVKWAKDDYNKTISLDQAKTIIDRATLRR